VAIVIPFPIVRRRDFVLRNAARIAEAQPKTAEKLLTHTINVQVETMARRGIAPRLIAREAKALATAIRCQLSHLTGREGDTA